MGGQLPETHERRIIVNCAYCNGVDTVKQETTRFCACDAREPFIVERVPAFVCGLCGDRSYSTDTIAELEKIKNGGAAVNDIRSVRVFLFDSLERASVHSNPLNTPVVMFWNVSPLFLPGMNIPNNPQVYHAMIREMIGAANPLNRSSNGWSALATDSVSQHKNNAREGTQYVVSPSGAQARRSPGAAPRGRPHITRSAPHAR